MNCKRKLLHCNANINFNKTCLKNRLLPRYAHIKIPEYNEAAKKTKTQAQIIRIKNEIKFLYKKKEQLNTQLYYKHLQNANTWQKTWNIIEDTINEKLQHEMKTTYLKQQQKLKNMEKSHTTTTKHNTNYTRVKNCTNTNFTQDEIQLLSKGLKYNLHYKNKKWIETLALEAETAITKLDITEQSYYRHVIAKQIKDISNNKNTQNANNKNKREWKIALNIKRKMLDNKLVITKADKGKTLVIITEEEYQQKIMKFIHENNFTLINKDPTQQYQNNIKQTIKICTNIIQKEQKWKYTNMNPMAPNLHATIKLHKHNTPIRPIINWRNAPAYQIAILLSKILHEYLQLPNAYNIHNSIHLMNDLNTIKIDENTRLCSFDIENMYTNIPKKDIMNITKNILQRNHNTNINTQKEIMCIMNTVLEQNYFQYEQKYYKQTDGLAMGAPTSAILAEIYIQNMEHTQIQEILNKQNIIGYFRYVDDILLLYDINKTNIDDMIIEFNKLQPTIKFTIEKETHETINFLDIGIYRGEENLQFSIHRKHTATDIIIPKDSCHPQEHKISGIKYLIDRVNNYPITKTAKDIEISNINNILINNKYNTEVITKLITNNKYQNIKKKQNNIENLEEQKTKMKWATFTYIGKETRTITKIFRDTKLKIAFRTKNNLQHILKTKPKMSKYNKSGIYRMKCLDCHKEYIGQTGRKFNTRYKEHIHDIRTNNSNTGYSEHILNTGHAYGTIENTMDIIATSKKGQYLNTLENYHIYRITKENTHMNNVNKEIHNPIFKELYTIYTE